MIDGGEETKEVKIIILGETGVGKTSLINRYVNNEFNIDSEVTLGSSSSVKVVKRLNINYRLSIWDTSGEEKYHSVTNLFIKGSNIVILIYSIDSRDSFEHLNIWYSAMKDNLDKKNYILAIVGSKSDLKNMAVVSEEEGRKFAMDKKALFKLVSAKDDPYSVNKLFDLLIDELGQINFESKTESYFIKKSPKKKKKDKKHHKFAC